MILEYFRNLGKSSAAAKQEGQLDVVINVYDMLQPSFLTGFGYYVLGVGIYHSGVAVGNKEYCFGGHEFAGYTGMFEGDPDVGPPDLVFKQSIQMGTVSKEDSEKVLQDISKEFLGTSYSLLTRNCNHFTDELCYRLTGKHAPTWINRAAKLGTLFPCVIPDLEGSVLQPPTAASPTSPPASSCPSNTPSKTSKSRDQTFDDCDKNTNSSTGRQRQKPAADALIRTSRSSQPSIDDIDSNSPVKEPDSGRPEVIRSATQLSISASLQ